MYVDLIAVASSKVTLTRHSRQVAVDCLVVAAPLGSVAAAARDFAAAVAAAAARGFAAAAVVRCHLARRAGLARLSAGAAPPPPAPEARCAAAGWECHGQGALLACRR